MSKRNGSYSEKLKDPRWQRKRLAILERDNWTCLRCSSQSTTLHVHHLRYAGEPWDVSDEDLETLCENCHERRKEVDAALCGLLKRLPTETIASINGMVGKLWEAADGNAPIFYDAIGSSLIIGLGTFLDALENQTRIVDYEI